MSQLASVPAPRIRRVTANFHGGYNLSNGNGEHIAHVVLAPQSGLGKARTCATRMAYSCELTAACRQADKDFEQTGTISRETINTIRQLLSDVGAA